MSVGINCTSGHVYCVVLDKHPDDGGVPVITRHSYSSNSPEGLAALYGLCCAMAKDLKSKAEEGQFGILVSQTGHGSQAGSSADTLKAEGVIELAFHQEGCSLVRVSASTLGKALEAARGEKWDARADAVFAYKANSLQYWQAGARGAAAVALKVGG